jgi:hypothetical protein
MGSVEVGIVSYSKAIIPVDPSRAEPPIVIVYDDSTHTRRYMSFFLDSALASAQSSRGKSHCPAGSAVTH